MKAKIKRNSALKASIAFCGAVCLSLLISLAFLLIAPKSQNNIWLNSLCSGLAMLLPIALLSKVEERNPLKNIAVIEPIEILAVVFITIAIMPAMNVLNILSMHIADNALTNAVSDAIRENSAVSMFICIACINPFMEEVLFRHYIYKKLRGYGLIVAVGVSSLMFALLHMNFNQFVYTLFFGIILALTAESTGGIMGSFLCHALFNFVELVLFMTPEYSRFRLVYDATVIGHVSPMSWVMLAIGTIAGIAVTVIILNLLCERRKGNGFLGLLEKEGGKQYYADLLNLPLIAGAVICIACIKLISF